MSRLFVMPSARSVIQRCGERGLVVGSLIFLTYRLLKLERLNHFPPDLTVGHLDVDDLRSFRKWMQEVLVLEEVFLGIYARRERWCFLFIRDLA